MLTRDSEELRLALAGPVESGEYGVWTDHEIPADRSDWHELVRRLYDYWLAIAPPGRLPGRQHMAPEDIPSLWSRLWMLDVYREPLRYRYRLCGIEMVRALGREVTGTWFDEAHPRALADPQLQARFRFVVERARATWRRGPPLCALDPDHRMVETCVVPLAADGLRVDKVLAISVMFDAGGRAI